METKVFEELIADMEETIRDYDKNGPYYPFASPEWVLIENTRKLIRQYREMTTLRNVERK